MFVSRRPRFREEELRAAVWNLSIDPHFDPDAVRASTIRRHAAPLEVVLVEQSTYHRGHLKERLYASGLKARRCELCGQGETWNSAQMSLILDHINGVPTDNRLENLRIVCPNCNATLATHCGRANRRPPRIAECAHCGNEFRPKYLAQGRAAALQPAHARAR
jgi:hypothetical protein